MNNKCLYPFALALLCSCNANGSVTLTFDTGTHPDSVYVSHIVLDPVKSPAPSSPSAFAVTDNSVEIPLDAKAPARYVIDFQPEDAIEIYASPEDDLQVKVTGLNPLVYSVTGTELMEDITGLKSKLDPIEADFRRLSGNGTLTNEQRQILAERYNRTAADFIRKNPGSPAGSYALMTFDGPEFMELLESVTPEGRKSILYPYAQAKGEQMKAMIEKRNLQQKLSSGEADAPDFTLNDLDGKPVSLSSFRGKWVIIDFWGSWCGWCIKGFPELKKNYGELKGKLEVVGVDCQDSEEDWKAAVVRHQLPWVNLYNPGRGDEVLSAYGVQGFPTKVLVSPEGKIADITTGEDPAFFEKVRSLVK